MCGSCCSTAYGKVSPVVQTRYGLRVFLPIPFERALEATIEQLREQGFGVLTEIDVQRTMREKLSAEFRRYVILGACNPHLAHRAFEAELDIGLLLPCNVIVYEQNGGSEVAVMDPLTVLGIVGNDQLRPVAEEARKRLEEALRHLSES